MYYLKSIIISVVSIVVVLKILSIPLLLIFGSPFEWIFAKRITDDNQLVRYRGLYYGALMAILLGIVQALCYKYFDTNIYILLIITIILFIYPAYSGKLNTFRVIDFFSEKDERSYYLKYSLISLICYLIGLYCLIYIFNYFV